MVITHPQNSYQGVSPENVFFVSTDQKLQLGTGWVFPYFQQQLYPEQPLRYYLQIDAQPQARELLFGALIARCHQLHAQQPQYPARVYAMISPDNLDMLNFYNRMGMKNGDAEEIYRFRLPETRRRVPMSMQFYTIPLGTVENQNMFLERMNQYRIQPILPDKLTLWQNQQHFLALGFFQGTMPVCETICIASGTEACLMALYTRSEYRRQGVARAMLDSTFEILRSYGVQTVTAQVFKADPAQQRLLARYNPEFIRSLNMMPGMDLN